MGARDFLLEIGTEELPGSACRAVLELVPERAAGLFAAADIDLVPGALDVMVGPRRIVVLVRGVPEEQTPRENAQRGPAVEAAFAADGTPTPAAAGFARAKGVAPEDLQVREENGRRFVFAVSRSEGRPTAELLPEICVKLVRDMYFPKNMRWGARDLRFSRPLRTLVALFGDELVPFEVAGVASGRISRGHRVLGAPVEVASASAYVDALLGARVLVDQREREDAMWAELRRLAEERGLSVIDPMNKMAEVLYLVEWPTVLPGAFGEEHLRLPDEVLITAMQSHQRYFPLVDADGSLASTFLFVMNGDPAHAAAITAGNERVLEGRIEDAEFSFDKDLATGLERMAGQLDRVVFHEKVGTMRDKTDRLVALAGYLADATGVSPVAKAMALEAARIAKADQVSVMVREFADLEGYMGETYAKLEGFHAEVAQAVREQYLPDAAGGEVPRTIAGALLATAEKVDNVVAAFAVGEPPSGSKDPHGLRRAAMGMVNISFFHGLRYNVRYLTEFAYGLLERFPHLAAKQQVVAEATDFILERLARVLTDSGVAARRRRRRPADGRSVRRPAGAGGVAGRLPPGSGMGGPGGRVLAPEQPGQEAPARRGRHLGQPDVVRRRSRARAAAGLVRGRRRHRADDLAAGLRRSPAPTGRPAAGRRPLLHRRPGDGRGRRRAAQPSAAARLDRALRALCRAPGEIAGVR